MSLKVVDVLVSCHHHFCEKIAGFLVDDLC